MPDFRPRSRKPPNGRTKRPEPTSPPPPNPLHLDTSMAPRSRKRKHDSNGGMGSPVPPTNVHSTSAPNDSDATNAVMAVDTTGRRTLSRHQRARLRRRRKREGVQEGSSVHLGSRMLQVPESGCKAPEVLSKRPKHARTSGVISPDSAADDAPKAKRSKESRNFGEKHVLTPTVETPEQLRPIVGEVSTCRASVVGLGMPSIAEQSAEKLDPRHEHLADESSAILARKPRKPKRNESKSQNLDMAPAAVEQLGYIANEPLPELLEPKLAEESSRTVNSIPESEADMNIAKPEKKVRKSKKKRSPAHDTDLAPEIVEHPATTALAAPPAPTEGEHRCHEIEMQVPDQASHELGPGGSLKKKKRNHKKLRTPETDDASSNLVPGEFMATEAWKPRKTKKIFMAAVEIEKTAPIHREEYTASDLSASEEEGSALLAGLAAPEESYVGGLVGAAKSKKHENNSLKQGSATSSLEHIVPTWEGIIDAGHDCPEALASAVTSGPETEPPKKRKRKKSVQTAATSPYFSALPSSQPSYAIVEHSAVTSLHFDTAEKPLKSSKRGTPIIPWPGKSAERFGLIQEELADYPFHLLVACCFCNVTTARAAVPKLKDFFARWPTPAAIAAADEQEVKMLIGTLGLANRRTDRIIQMAKVWEVLPSRIDSKTRLNIRYPVKDTLPFPEEIHGDEPLGVPSKLAWEIGHIPGVGAYALDAWRIFCRDKLRGLEGVQGVEPEWKRVVPKDKELRGYIRWKWWATEGKMWHEEQDGEDHPSVALREETEWIPHPLLAEGRTLEELIAE